MKKYYGFHTGKPGPQKVMVKQEDGVETELVHVIRHSPDGFNFGYNGSGPSDLALSILFDVLNDYTQANHLYIQFREAFVSSWKSCFSITEQQVLDWVAEHEEH